MLKHGWNNLELFYTLNETSKPVQVILKWFKIIFERLETY